MKLRTSSSISRRVLLMLPLSCAGAALGQRDVGLVRTADAIVTGTLSSSGGNFILGPSSSVKTIAHMAPVILVRGGVLNVCPNSTIRLQVGKNKPTRSTNWLDPIRLSIDRGSVEIQVPMTTTDSITVAGTHILSAAPPDRPYMVDLAITAAAHGMTCVENHGEKSPPLLIADPLGQTSYLLKPGQYAVFERGVIMGTSAPDTFSCGCNPIIPQNDLLAQNTLPFNSGRAPFFHPDALPFPFPANDSRDAPLPPKPQPEILDPAKIKVASVLDYYAPPPGAESDPTLASPLTAGTLDQPSNKPATLLQALPAPAKPHVTARFNPNQPSAYLVPKKELATRKVSVPRSVSAPHEGSVPSKESGPRRYRFAAIGHFFKRIFGR